MYSQGELYYDREFESVTYLSLALRCLTKFCKFGTMLHYFLQTQFINKLRDLRIKEKISRVLLILQRL